MVHIWDVTSGDYIGQLSPLDERVLAAGFTDDNRPMTLTSGGKLRLFQCDICRPIGDLVSLTRRRVLRSLTNEERIRYLHDTTSVQE